MKYKIGDKVVFKAQSHKQYAWKLNDYEVYEIIKRETNQAFSGENVTPLSRGILPRLLLNPKRISIDYKPNTTYYGVKDKKGVEANWFEYDDFMSVKKYRKQKLQKIIKTYGN